jgi:hypothetical protein
MTTKVFSLFPMRPNKVVAADPSGRKPSVPSRISWQGNDIPPIIETDMTARIRSDEETRRYLLERHPVARFDQSEEVAAAVLYQCSLEAAFITGVALLIDGRLAM